MSAPFEGFEKRLELRFDFDVDDDTINDDLGLRRLPLATINSVLSAVQCTIVSAVANPHFDAYILSESSLFIYPTKLIIKTCGTTQLLNAIPSLLPHTGPLGLTLSSSRYSRGSFLFPASQPFPHTSFQDEVHYLDTLLPPHLSHRTSSVLPNRSHNHDPYLWHVHSSSASSSSEEALHTAMNITVEVCMTDLQTSLAAAFYRTKSDHDIGLNSHEIGRRMTVETGIGDINPRALVCGYAFDPCGYSMNGLDRDRYSTIHVTPEEGFSYASFECVDTRLPVIADAVASAVRVFGPGFVSVSVCGGEDGPDCVLQVVEKAMRQLGMECLSSSAEEFPGAGVVTYQTFSAIGRHEY